MTPSAATWLELFVDLAIGVAVIVLATALLARWLTRSAWQRALWQVCTLGLAALCFVELAGLNHELAGALQMMTGDSARTDSASVLVSPREPEKTALIVPPLRDETTQERLSVLLSDKERNNGEPIGEWAKRGHGDTAKEQPCVALCPIRRLAVSQTDAGRASWLSRLKPWWPGLIWLLGSGVVAGRSAIARLLLVLFRFRHPAIRDAEFLARLDSVARRLGICRRVRVIETSGLVTPFTFGVIRPTIAWPASFAEDFDPSRQEAMLAHELAHVAGRDPAWLLAADLVTAVLWWHPLAWWFRHQLRTAGEAAADEASLLVTDGPVVLAVCLVELGGRLLKSRQVGGAAMAGTGFRSSLGRRVERLLQLNGQPCNRPGRVRFLFVLAIPILLMGTTLATAWAHPKGFSKGDDPMTWQNSWNRSIAGMVMCAFLVPAADTVVAQDPPIPAPDQQKIERKAGVTLPAQEQSVPNREPLGRPPSDQIPATGPRSNGNGPIPAPSESNSTANDVAVAPPPQQEPAQRIKIFRLTHRQPAELLQLFQGGITPQFEGGAQGQPLPFTTFIEDGARLVPPLPGGPSTSLGSDSATADMVLRMRSFSAQPRIGGSEATRKTCYFAIDQRTRSLIVRGTEKDLQTVADFVAILDLPADKPLPKLKNVHAFKLRFADPRNVAAVLTQLNIDVVVAHIPKSTILLLNGPESAIKEATEIIEALDAEVKSEETKPEAAAPQGY